MGGPVFKAVLTGDWQKLGAAFARLSVEFPRAMQQALEEEGEFYRGKIVEGIRKQAPGDQPFRPLSPITLALRRLMGFRGTKALIQSGELRNNVLSVPEKGKVFVGILYTARGRDGRKLADIGKINEYGATIRAVMSKKRMRLIAALMRKTGSRGSGGGGGYGAAMIRIPPRPFIRPVFALYGGVRGAERFMARVSRKLGGLLGVVNHPDLGGFSAARLPERIAGGNVGRSMRTSRTGFAQKPRKQNAKAMGKQMMRAITRVSRRPGFRGSRPARPKRAPKIITPKLGRRARTRAAKPPKLRAPRAPRAPKAPKAPKVRVHKPSPALTAKRANRIPKAAAAFNKRNAAAAARSAKQARAQAKQQARQSRAALKRGRAIVRGQQRTAAQQRRAAAAQRKQVRQQARAAKQAAKAARQQQRSAKKSAKQQARADKYVSMFTRLLEKREGQHRPQSAHVKAYRAHLKKQRPDAHVKAYKSRQKQPQHNAHVKAHRKATKKK